MSAVFNAAHRIHRFCVEHLLYPLILSSVLASMLLAGRMYLSHNGTYRFLNWNLFLAWIPYLCSLVIAFLHQRYPRRWWLLLIPTGMWLIFLPNAPYIVTDLLHLDERHPIPLWYDIGLLVTFAWSGLILGVASLNIMQNVVKDFLGRIASWLFVFGAIGSSALGIYLGRFLNWNSWDLFFEPHSIILDIVTRFAHPLRNPGAFGFTMMFAAFMLIAYITFASIQHRTEQAKS